MGVIVSDSLTLNNGITVDSYYAAIADMIMFTSKSSDYYVTRGTSKSSDNYVTRGTIKFWVSKSARDEGTPPFDTKEYCVLSNIAPTVSPYETIYTDLKAGLTNYTDDL
tara:strand:+ start:1396 stop:1722 length:327 start_codon:yes stop_codon:yes gene_type:complete